MFQKLKSAISTPVSESAPTSGFPSRAGTPPPKDANHHARAQQERQLAQTLLQDASVPVSLADCRTCSDPCDEEQQQQQGGGHGGGAGPSHVSFPRNFEVDWDSDLLGSSKPNDRQLVVSTSKCDWPHDHTEDKTTLSHHLAKVLPDIAGDDITKKGAAAAAAAAAAVDLPAGIYESAPLSQSRFGLFSSSIVPQSHHEDDAGSQHQSVLVLPDWQVVIDVENSPEGAKALIDGVVMGGNQAASTTQQQTWTLPYRAVILLCSHKRRDKRCHVAAPLLEKALCSELENHSVHVDLKGDALSSEALSDAHPSGPLSDLPPGPDRDARAEEQKRQIEAVEDEQGGGSVGIFRISHLGGHRYAGVMIIIFPSGATLYYGRVSPHEIASVVRETILSGKVMAGLLRSGGNVQRPELAQVAAEGSSCSKKGKSLLSW